MLQGVRKDLFAGLDGDAESLNQLSGARLRAEEVALGSRIRRSPPEMHRRVDDVLEQVGVCTPGDLLAVFSIRRTATNGGSGAAWSCAQRCCAG